MYSKVLNKTEKEILVVLKCLLKIPRNKVIKQVVVIIVVDTYTDVQKCVAFDLR